MVSQNAAESERRYWIGKRCPHWSAHQNRRFRLYRIDGPSDHCGRYPGAVWDANRKEWIDQRRLGGIKMHELARPASSKDLKGVVLDPLPIPGNLLPLFGKTFPQEQTGEVA